MAGSSPASAPIVRQLKDRKPPATQARSSARADPSPTSGRLISLPGSAHAVRLGGDDGFGPKAGLGPSHVPGEAARITAILQRKLSCNYNSCMKIDNRLSGILHCLLHMAELGGPATSEWLAQAMRTNPVVIRRLMAGLRDAGFVASEKGHGGGWVLSCALEDITLRDIHEAVGAPKLLAVGHREGSPSCLVEQAVNAALQQAFRKAEAVLLARLGSVTLAALARDFHRRLAASGRSLSEVSHDF